VTHCLGGVTALLPDSLAAHRKLTAAGPQPPARAPPLSPTPSLYEMAALTSELDTQVVTTKVKELLLANNLGQKVCQCTVLYIVNGAKKSLKLGTVSKIYYWSS
jgi:hypothetical protein